jgi:hypothetical protein
LPFLVAERWQAVASAHHRAPFCRTISPRARSESWRREEGPRGPPWLRLLASSLCGHLRAKDSTSPHWRRLGLFLYLSRAEQQANSPQVCGPLVALPERRWARVAFCP